jgi:hypothetical protein
LHLDARPDVLTQLKPVAKEAVPRARARERRYLTIYPW